MEAGVFYMETTGKTTQSWCGRLVDPTQKTHRIPSQNAAGTGESLKKFQCSTIAAGNCRKMKHFKKRIIQDLVGSVVIGPPPLISAMGFGHLEGVVKKPDWGQLLTMVTNHCH